MINIVKQTVDFYLLKMRKPQISELEISNSELLSSRGSCFITIFLNGEIRGSAGNIKEIENSLADEIISNTIEAISNDKRFSKLTTTESEKIKIRIDLITNRKVLARTDEEAKTGIQTISKIDPIKKGIIIIKKDYTKTVTILPNIDSKLITGSDYKGILSAKLDEDFEENKYIIYEIETKVESDY